MQHYLFKTLRRRYPDINVHDMCVSWYPNTDAVHIYHKNFFVDISEYNNLFSISIFLSSKHLLSERGISKNDLFYILDRYFERGLFDE